MADCTVIVFPLDRRVGRVRDVAKKMAAKSSDRHAEHHRDQVTGALLTQMQRIGLGEEEQNAQLEEFWQSVQAEMIRQVFKGSRPGGSAA